MATKGNATRRVVDDTNSSNFACLLCLVVCLPSCPRKVPYPKLVSAVVLWVMARRVITFVTGNAKKLEVRLGMAPPAWHFKDPPSTVARAWKRERVGGCGL